MKILIPVIGFGRAGGYRVLSELANTWIKYGHDVDFLCIDSSATPYYPTRANIIHVNELGESCNQVSARVDATRWRHVRSLFRGLNSIGRYYDVILANHSLTAWPVAFSSCGSAKKMYYIQAYEPGYYAGAKNINGYVFAIGSALTYHFNLKRIVNSPLYYNYMNLKASVFVPPGLSLSKFKPGLGKRNLEEAESIVIGCIGRNEPEKGTIYVLEAFKKLYAKDPRFRLRIACYGEMPNEWSHKNCEVIVPQNDCELADYYRSVDILVASGTVQHGAPHYPVLESAACGVCVVTTGYMGATSDTAWIVENKNSDSIVSTILHIAQNDNLRLQKIAKFLDVIPTYSWDSVATIMLEEFLIK